MAALAARDVKIEEEQKQMRETLKRLEGALAQAEAAPASAGSTADSSAAREADPTILRLNVNGLVAKTEIEEAIHPWLMDAQIERGAYKLVGGELSRRFMLQFQGAPGLASMRAKKAFGILKLPDGSYRRMAVRDLPIFVEFDKTARQIKGERALGIMHKHLKGLFPTNRVDKVKRDALIAVDMQPTVTITVSEDLEVGFDWKEQADVLEVDKPAAQTAVNAALVSRSRPWG